MADKITMKIGFERARKVFEEMGDSEMVAFFDKRLEQVAKRATAERKLTPHQLENEQVKEAILNEMQVGESYTIRSMLETFTCFPPTMTVNRLAALLSQLGPNGSRQIERFESKGKAYFSLPDYSE